MEPETNVAEGRLETLQIYKVLQCVRDQDKGQIEKLTQLGVHNLINLTEPSHGEAALHLAAVANNVDMCSFLLHLGAHPDIQDLKGCTPAMKATELGHDLVLEVLAEAQADMTVVNKEGKDGRARRRVVLADAAAGAYPKLETGRTALIEAAREGALEVVRSILKKGGDVNAFDKQRYHAVHFAAKGGFLEILMVLSAYKGDMGIIAMDCNTALHHAAGGGFADCCRFLGQRGCDPNWKNISALTPKAVAKQGRFKAAMKELGKAMRLFKKYSKPGVKNPNPPWAITLHDWSFEHQAILRESFAALDKGDGTVAREEFVAVLLEKGAPLTTEELDSVILLHEKGRGGNINVEEFLKGSKYLQKAFLLSSYGPKKKKGKKGKKGKRGKKTLLMPICTMPSHLISRREDGGPPNFMIETFHNLTDLNRFDCDHPPQNPLTDDTGWYVDDLEKVYTQINFATRAGDLDSLKKAFEEGVPVDVKDVFFKTPLISACAYGNMDIVKFLLEKGAHVNARDNFMWTPLHHACHAGQQDIAKLLLKNGAKIDAVALNGSTPLMRAVESGSLDCAQFLIKSGAKVQIMNKKGQNVLDIAKAYADYRLIDLIQAKLDSLPKPKEKKGGKGKVKMEGKSRSVSKPQTPAISDTPPIKQEISRSTEMIHSDKEKKSYIARMNHLITLGETKKVDITFVPKTVWVSEPNTADLIRKREHLRQRFTYEVDFEDFKMPFSKNLAEKTLALVST
ncbi:PREDICTED: ankyrin repeat and EF-hand domain-containing protein 1 [Nanorana parkeri]|uniref:ankyrin repeat and EF-hand domain-containing protein 1 n=1 Tax=Nanorana parkeri TaxID=125878 RepID=UPI00085436DD|nr:PREDICTED: ankyrin repeat and EF-hand domain-containing protein 1 [Nanorana parkeri]